MASKTLFYSQNIIWFSVSLFASKFRLQLLQQTTSFKINGRLYALRCSQKQQLRDVTLRWCYKTNWLLYSFPSSTSSSVVWKCRSWFISIWLLTLFKSLPTNIDSHCRLLASTPQYLYRSRGVIYLLVVAAWFQWEIIGRSDTGRWLICGLSYTPLLPASFAAVSLSGPFYALPSWYLHSVKSPNLLYP